MAEIPSGKSQETTPKEYSRENISREKRETESKNIKKANNDADLKKTEEGRAKLSTQWMDRANLSGAQKQQILRELKVTSPNNAKEIDTKVKAWQKEHGLVDPKTNEPDGILGWATLEALDNVIEKADKEYDKKQKNAEGSKEGYGLARVRVHEKKNLENYLAKREKRDNTTEKKEEKIVSVEELTKHSFPWKLSDFTKDNTIVDKYPDTAPMGKDLRAALPEIKKILQENPEMGDLKLAEYKLLKQDPYNFALEQADKPNIDTNRFSKGAQKIPGKENLGYVVQVEEGSKKVIVWKIASNGFLEQEGKKIYINGKEAEKA